MRNYTEIRNYTESVCCCGWGRGTHRGERRRGQNQRRLAAALGSKRKEKPQMMPAATASSSVK